MAHRIYKLDPSYWRVDGGSLTTSGLFSFDTDAFILSPLGFTSNGWSKTTILTAPQFSAFRTMLGSGFTIPNSSQYTLSSWQALGFGNSLQDVLDNYIFFLEANAVGVSGLNPEGYGLATILVSGLIGGVSYFIPILVFSSQGELVTAVDASPVIGDGITFDAVTLTSMTVIWGVAYDAITPQANLQYKLVRSNSAALLDTVVNAELNGIVVMDWSVNTTFYADSGLNINTSYAYAVIVKDANNNKSLYPAQTQSTLTDIVPPVVGTSIVFSGITEFGATVSWGVATDSITAQALLEYKLVRSLTNNLTSVSLAETNGTTVMDYSANTLTYNVTGLNEVTAYYFAVVVRDEHGNKSLYPQQLLVTLDVSGPSVGTSIQSSNVTSSSVDLSWGAATDNSTASNLLQYRVVYSALNNISSVFDANSNGTVLMDWSVNTTNYSVTGFVTATYYFAVLVKDASGNTSIYSPIPVALLDIAPPSVGVIILSSITASSIDVSFPESTDNISAQPSILYKVVYSQNSSDVNSVSAAASVPVGSFGTNGSTDFAPYINPVNFTGLSEATLYYFTVVAKDEAGNMDRFSPVSDTTSDVTPPIVGGGLAASNIGDDSLDLTWLASTDNYTPQSSLQYRVLSSTSNNISTVSDANTNGSLLMDWTANTTTYGVTGLSAGTYYFAVLVRDSSNNTNIYSPIQATVSLPPVITTFSASLVPPDDILISFSATDDLLTAISLNLYRADPLDLPVTVAGAESGTLIHTTSIASGGSGTFTDLDLPVGDYGYAIVAQDAGGRKSFAIATVISGGGGGGDD